MPLEVYAKEEENMNGINKYLPVVVVIIIVLLIGAGLVLAVVQSGNKTALPPDKPLASPTVIAQPNEEITPTIGATATPVPSKSIELTITSPSSNTTVTSPKLTIRGKTVPRAEVYINDLDTIANASGIFSAQVTLDEGENTILVIAGDSEGNYAEKELTVTYDIP